MIISDIEKDFKKINSGQRNGIEYRWEGFTVVKFTPSGRATFSPKGVYHNGTYGFEERFEVNNDGRWYLN